MSAKTISEHTAQILGEIQKVRMLSAEEIISHALELRDLKPADILDDLPGRFHSRILETRS